MANENPCLNCTMVEQPMDCDRKFCLAWQDWWIERWDAMRSRYCGTTTDEERKEEQ